MKKNIISIILVAVIILTTVIVGVYVFRDMGEKQLSPEDIVVSFYEDWREYDGNPIVDKFYEKNSYLTDSYKEKLKQIIISFDKSAYDPVLCAQDIAQDIQINNAAVKEDRAVVITEHVFSGGNKLVELVLEREDKNWKISDIICQEGQGADQINNVSPAIQSLVGGYIHKNINNLSPEPAVLGGTFHVNSVQFTSPNTCVVDYEDGHINLTARVDFSIPEAAKVEIKSFEIINKLGDMFVEIGNIVEKNNSWDFVYEEPGKPALRMRLVFTEDSRCMDERSDFSCFPVYWKTGDRAEISGKKEKDTLIVENLRIIGENSKNISGNISDLPGQIDSFDECKLAGYEIYFPDCIDCQPYCETADGQRFEQESKNKNLICIDNCGNGICEEIVCMGSGCPCAETSANCPADCN